MRRSRAKFLLAISLAAAKVATSMELSPEGYAEILATNSPQQKEEFIETIVTQKLHGFVTSDEGLKSFAETAPATWPALLSQLSGQPWLCGGATGRLCDNPLTAPLSEQGWASALRANATARGILAKRIAEERLHAKVTNEQELMEWARLAPDSFDAALAELKSAEFLCGGDTTQRCPGSFSSELQGHQRSAVTLGYIAFAVLGLAAFIIAALSFGLYMEDRSLREKQREAAHEAKMRFFAALRSTVVQAPAAQRPMMQADMRMAAAPVMYYQVPAPMLPLSGNMGSARSMSAGGQPPPQALPISPGSLARAAAEPWPV